MFDIDRRPANRDVAKILKKGFEYTPERKFNQKPRSVPLVEITYQGPREHDIRGKRFGRFVVVGYIGTNKNRKSAKWDCRCDCGNYEAHFAVMLKRTKDKNGDPYVPMCEGCCYIKSLKWKGSNERSVQDLHTDEK